MSALKKKISNKKKLFPKNINQKLSSALTKLTTVNSCRLFNSAMNSYHDNFYITEKLAYSSIAIEKNNIFQKSPILEKKSGKLSYNNSINNKFIISKEFSYNNKNSISKINNNKRNKNKMNIRIRKRKKNNDNTINLLNKSSDIGNNKKKETLKTSKTFILERFTNQNTKNEDQVKEGSKIMPEEEQNNSEEKKGEERKIIFSRNFDLKSGFSSFKYIKNTLNSYLTRTSNNIKNNIYTKSRNKNSFLTKINKNKTNKIVCNKKNIKHIVISLNNKNTRNSSKDKNNCNLMNYLGNPNYSTNTIFRNKRNIYDNKTPLNITKRENNDTKIINKKTCYNIQKRTNRNINCLTNKNSPLNRSIKYYKPNKIYNTKKIIINREKLNKNSNNNISKNSRATENKNLKNINNKNKITVKNIEPGNNIKRVNNLENNNNKIISLEKKDNSFDMTKTNTKLNNILEKTDNEIKINNIKINEYNVKKPKEENMKFKLFINRTEEETEEIIFHRNNSINLLNSNYEEKDKENNNIKELEINNNTNTYQFLSNNIEINSILKYDEKDSAINDLSTSIFDVNNKYKNNLLLPYNEKIISYENKYNTKTNSNLLKGNINKLNAQIMNDNKISDLKKYSKKNNNINKIKQGKNS